MVLDVLQKLWYVSAQIDRGPTMDPSFLLAFPLLLALSTPCSACICKLQHPQTFYCTSDVVVIADILGPGKDTKTKRGLQVNVTQILKAPGKNLRIQNIYSPLKFEDCGYELRTNFQSQLLIAGYLRRGKLHFTRCHLVYFWYRLTTEQRLGFQAAYRMGCSCQVQPCLRCLYAPAFNLVSQSVCGNKETVTIVYGKEASPYLPCVAPQNLITVHGGKLRCSLMVPLQ
ncbi:metalloproteinase inhibitor 1 isoform X2 [Equus caballus]|uniref:metalloproteinase inhibitor 1 isoform X2 n=1 Tax=Equus caballus TaxID=9796 RepID=UPI0038B24D2F